MGAMQRSKGARGEREVKALLRENGFPRARRTLAGDGEQPGDLGGGPAGWVIEVKWWADVTAAVRLGLRQAHDEAETAGEPWACVAVRLPGGPWVVVIDGNTWLRHSAFVGTLHHARKGTIPQRLRFAHSTGPTTIGGGLVAMSFAEWVEAARHGDEQTTAA